MKPYYQKSKEQPNSGENQENRAIIVWIFAMVFSYFIVVPLGTISTVAVTDFRLYDLMFIVGFVFIILPRMKQINQTIKTNKWIRAFFQFCLWIGFSVIMVVILRNVSAAIVAAARVARFVFYGLTAAAILTFVKNRQTLYRLIWFFFIMATIEAWLSLLQFYRFIPTFFPTRWDYYGFVPSGTLGPHHLQMGLVCAMAVCMGMALAINTKSLFTKFFVAVSTGVLVFASFAVESRSGWVGIAVGTIYLVFRLARKVTFATVSMAIMMGFGVYLFFNYAGPAVAAQIERTFFGRIVNPIQSQGVSSLSETRVALVNDMPEIILKYPWVLITGTGTQNSVSVLTYGNALHNNYLHVLVEGGLLGFFLYLRMVLSIWKQTNISQSKAGPTASKVIALGFQSAFLVVLVTNLYNEAFYFQYATFSLSGQILSLAAMSTSPIWLLPTSTSTN